MIGTSLTGLALLAALYVAGCAATQDKVHVARHCDESLRPTDFRVMD